MQIHILVHSFKKNGIYIGSNPLAFKYWSTYFVSDILYLFAYYVHLVLFGIFKIVIKNYLIIVLFNVPNVPRYQFL